jgi:predicted nicotinamide N-methyase
MTLTGNRKLKTENPLTKDQEPLPIPGGWAVRRFDLGGREIAAWVPACPDAFLEDADSIAAHGPSAERPERSDIPFWQYLWPAALSMARLVFAHDWDRERLRDAEPFSALELGAGVGLVGLAALARGLRVTFTDYQEPALIASAANASLNGFTDFETELLDWHAPGSKRYPIILGCEVIYERAIHEPILNVLDAMLSPKGVAWLGDPGRSHVPAFLEKACQRGYEVEIRSADDQPLPAPVFGEFQLLILRRL